MKTGAIGGLSPADNVMAADGPGESVFAGTGGASPQLSEILGNVAGGGVVPAVAAAVVTGAAAPVVTPVVAPAAAAAVVAPVAAAASNGLSLADERARVNGILASRDLFPDVTNISVLAEEAIRSGQSIEAFESRVLQATRAARQPSSPAVTAAVSIVREQIDRTNQAFSLVLATQVDPGLEQRLRVGTRGIDSATAQALGFENPTAAVAAIGQARRVAGGRAIGIRGTTFAYAASVLGLAVASRMNDEQIFAWCAGGGLPAGIRADVGHTASDFPNLLLDSMNKSIESQRAMWPVTWDQFCSVRNLKDFRTHSIIRPAGVGHWTEINTESVDDERTEVSDGSKETIAAKTFSTQFGITRKMRVNDDFGAIGEMLGLVVRKAQLVPEILVHQVIEGIAGTAMADGVVLFHADHANIGTSAALSMDSLDAGIVAFETQNGEGPDAATDYDFSMHTPEILLVPPQLRGIANDLYTNDYKPVTNNMAIRNTVKGLVRPVVSRILGRKSATAWYLMAGPMSAAIEVGFLDGNRSPTVVQIGNGDPTEINYKGYFDVGVAAKDFKAGRKNVGT